MFSLTSKSSDAMAQLLGGHLVLVQKVPKLGFVVDVAFLLNIQAGSTFRRKFLGNGFLAVIEVFQKVGGDGEIVASTEFSDLACVAEGGTHY